MKWFILNFIIIIIFNCFDTIQIMALQLGALKIPFVK